MNDDKPKGRTPVRVTGRSAPHMLIIGDPTEEEKRLLEENGWELVGEAD